MIEVGYTSINAKTVEKAYAKCQERQDAKDWHWPIAAMRAAKARDPKMMKVLELCAEVMQELQENQSRETRRSSDFHPDTVEFTEYQLFREAYRMADEGKHETMEHFLWIYGACGYLCGYSR